MEYHNPVLLKETVDGLNIHPDGVYVDVTFGGGGHSREIMSRLGEKGKLFAFDQDLDALKNAIDDERFTLINENFRFIKRFLRFHGIKQVDGILADLGVSSHQFDDAARGFSIRFDADLDMRMDQSRGITAAEIINTYQPGELVRILRVYGEEKFATRIVENIVKARAIAPINSTTELAMLVKESIPAATRRTGGNPAKRTFQALRIEANDELGAITRALPQALDLLMVQGRLVVMSFQSLEDRIVKEVFLEASTSKSPRNLPIELPEFAAKFSLVFRSGETPSQSELDENPRSASVRLRAIERVAA